MISYEASKQIKNPWVFEPEYRGEQNIWWKNKELQWVATLRSQGPYVRLLHLCSELLSSAHGIRSLRLSFPPWLRCILWLLIADNPSYNFLKFFIRTVGMQTLSGPGQLDRQLVRAEHTVSVHAQTTGPLTDWLLASNCCSRCTSLNA